MENCSDDDGAGGEATKDGNGAGGEVAEDSSAAIGGGNSSRSCVVKQSN